MKGTLAYAGICHCVCLGGQSGTQPHAVDLHPLCHEGLGPPSSAWSGESLVVGPLPFVPSPSQHSVASTGHMGWYPCASGPEWEPLLSLNTLETDGGAA